MLGAQKPGRKRQQAGGRESNTQAPTDRTVAGRAKGDSRDSKRRQFVVSKRRRAIKSGLLSEPLVWGRKL
jgi:hypothetical protein